MRSVLSLCLRDSVAKIVLTAAVLALMPYHVIVSRQVLLDGAETFFATLALYLLASYGSEPRRVALVVYRLFLAPPLNTARQRGLR